MNNLVDNKGQALVVVIFIMVVLLTIGLTSTILWKSREKTFIYQEQKVQAYYNADSGIERVLARLKQEPEWGYEVPYSFIDFYSSGSVEVQVKRVEEAELLVHSEGYEGYGRSTLEAVIRFAGTLEVVYWKEKYPVLPD